jgi:hypothetical protein
VGKMSLDFYLHYKIDRNRIEVFSRNITHNLNEMAGEAGLYIALWYPFKLKISTEVLVGWFDVGNDSLEDEFENQVTVYAYELIDKLNEGLNELKLNPNHFIKFEAENSWGTYGAFVKFVEDVLSACEKYPNAIVEVSR